MKNTFFLYLSLISVSISFAAYTNAVWVCRTTMNKDNKEILFFSDFHCISGCNSYQCHQKLVNPDKLVLLKRIRQEAEKEKKICVLVEDKATLLKLHPYWDFTEYTTALLGLENDINTNKLPNVSCINVEFRDSNVDTSELQNEIKKTTQPELFRRLKSHYSDFRRNHHKYFKNMNPQEIEQEIKESILVDANIINNIKKTTADTIIVCAGATHTKSVEKQLYNDGARYQTALLLLHKDTNIKVKEKLSYYLSYYYELPWVFRVLNHSVSTPEKSYAEYESKILKRAYERLNKKNEKSSSQWTYPYFFKKENFSFPSTTIINKTKTFIRHAKKLFNFKFANI